MTGAMGDIGAGWRICVTEAVDSGIGSMEGVSGIGVRSWGMTGTIEGIGSSGVTGARAGEGSTIGSVWGVSNIYGKVGS